MFLSSDFVIVFLLSLPLSLATPSVDNAKLLAIWGAFQITFDVYPHVFRRLERSFYILGVS